MKIMLGFVQRCTPERSEIWNCALDIRRDVAQRGEAYAYNLSTVRQRERRRVEQAEKAYERSVRGWTRQGPKVRTGAAKEERQ
jgi:hypothetical protein